MGRAYALTSDSHERLKLELARNMWGPEEFYQGIVVSLALFVQLGRMNGTLGGYEGRQLSQLHLDRTKGLGAIGMSSGYGLDKDTVVVNVHAVVRVKASSR
jgi:hypothetical protein